MPGSSPLKPDLRRIVTGHREDGRSCVVSRGKPPFTARFPDGSFYNEIWKTSAPVEQLPYGFEETVTADVSIEPAIGGTAIRIADIAPSADKGLSRDVADSLFEQLGEKRGAAHGRSEDSVTKNPFMHRTKTIDYVIVIKGSVTLGLDAEEIILNEGDVVVQLACNHYWVNHTSSYARLAYVMSSAEFPEHGG